MQTGTMSEAAIAAAIRLLEDDDSRVRRACRTRILASGEAARTALEAAASASDPRLRVRARALLRSIELAAWVDDFQGSLRTTRLLTCGDRILEVGLEALVRFPGLAEGDPSVFRRRLDALVAELHPLVAGRSSLTASRRLAQILAQRHDLAGERLPCGAQSSWLPDRVLQSARGPSSILAAIYLIVARRAGIDATGVCLPDFVLVRLHGRRNILVDPYHRGRSVTKADCLRYLRRVLPSRPVLEQLADVSDVEVLDRVVEDLILVHDRPADGELRDALRLARTVLAPGRAQTHG
ncbi:MAG: transglutaminase family protein [Planctomycetota bacterium]|jgi:hypothetical protein